MDNRFDLLKNRLKLLVSKNTWQNKDWKFNGRFYLPTSVRVQTREEVTQKLMDETIAVAVVHQNVFGEQMSVDRLLELMTTISYSSWILLLSRIAAVLSSRGKHIMKTQIQLAQIIFDEKTLTQIDSISESGNKIIFSDWQIANLVKIALLKCKQLPTSPNEMGDNKESIGLCLLGINDYFGRRTPIDAPDTEEDTETNPLYEALIRTYCYQFGENPKHLLARFYDLYFKLPSTEEGKAIQPYVDIQHEFQLITGISLETYLAVGFGFYAKYATAGLPAKKGVEGYTSLEVDDFLIDRRSFFGKTKIPASETSLILEDFCIDATRYQTRHQEQYNDSLGQLYDFTIFRQKPLVALNEYKLAPVVIDWLYEKLGEGCYWRINDGIEDPAKQKAFRNFFGPLYQLYVQRVFERLYPDSDLAQRVTYDAEEGGQRSSDVILTYPNHLVLFEAKWPTLRMEATMIPGDMQAFDKDLEDIIIKSARQLDRNIRDISTNKLKLKNVDAEKITAFYLVIIIARPFPIGPALTPYILDKVAANNLLNQQYTRPLEIISTEELELIEPVIAEGTTFPELLEKKRASPYHFYNMKWYLYSIKGQGKLPVNEYIGQLFEEFSDISRDILFGA
jgi:hypothetical protein